jgi:large subunit ribosomal protein L10
VRPLRNATIAGVRGEAKLRVVKNTLATKALDGSVSERGDALFKRTHRDRFRPGPCLRRQGRDPVCQGEREVLGHRRHDGSRSLDKASIAALARLPSLDQLRAKIIGLLQAPATKIAGVLQAPAGQLARVVGAYAAKDAA